MTTLEYAIKLKEYIEHHPLLATIPIDESKCQIVLHGGYALEADLENWREIEHYDDTPCEEDEFDYDSYEYISGRTYNEEDLEDDGT